MDQSLLQLINEIKASDLSVIYSSFRNLFSHIRFPVCKFQITPGHKILYRVRSHTKGDGNYFFNNIGELSYIEDVTIIKNFGRCNEPLQSRFYASDNELIAFTEVSEIVKTENKKDAAYHTTSAWKLNSPILVSPIFEPDKVDINNPDMVAITKKCFEVIQNATIIVRPEDKTDLKLFLKDIANEFTKPSSLEKNAYLFSAAYANYIFGITDIDGDKVEGLVYPTCINKSSIRGQGINYVFDNSIIGFDNKIEFVGAYRSKLERSGNEYTEVERIQNKSFNKITHNIEW